MFEGGGSYEIIICLRLDCTTTAAAATTNELLL